MISIIVPVYNAKTTLQRCLNCLLQQTIPDMEVILVDDGSTDSSGAICDDYAIIDKRIRVMHQSNKGVSAARNLGLQMAVGDQIAFCDADDWVDKDWLECMIQKMDETTLVISSIRAFTEDGVTFHTGKSLRGDIKQCLSFLKQRDVLGYLFNKLFDARVIREHNLQFDERFRFREDEDFVLKYAQYMTSIVFLEKAAYNYQKPDLSTKYSHLDNFYTSLSMFKTVAKIYQVEKSKSDMYISYLQELTNALFISFEWQLPDCGKRLRLYQQTVGMNVLQVKDLSFLTRILCLLPTQIVSPLFLIKSKKR